MPQQEYGYTQAFLAQRDAQRKFDYYFLGVTLALLTLSIQTFNASIATKHVQLMIFTWLALLISFLSGLYRQEMNSLFFKNEAIRMQYEPKLESLRKIVEKGEALFDSSMKPWSLEDISKEINTLRSIVDSASSRQDKYNTRANIAYGIHKWFFVLAILSFVLYKVVNCLP
ncbi:hypothetical protein DCC62_24710 [candidate division KSB1 bacterium]|nr:MAG: hypothetical protein DCC62_24710 [candidate division KSB1 bacterium]